MNSKRNSHLNSQRLPARRIRRLVTRYASDSDEEGGIVLKSKRYTDVTVGTAAGSDWMAKGANHIMAATSQQEVLLNKTQDRDVKAFGRANRSLCDDGTETVLKELLTSEHLSSTQSARERKTSAKRKCRKKDHRTMSDQRVTLSDDLLRQIASMQSPWALARFAKLSNTTLRLCMSEMRHRFSHKTIDVHFFLSDGVYVDEICDDRLSDDCSEIIERICSLMDYLLECDAKIIGFCNFPRILSNSSVVIRGRLVRRFRKTFSRCFANFPICHLQNISPQILKNATVSALAAQNSSRITSLDITITNKIQLAELAFVGNLENLVDVSLKILSHCFVLNCRHGKRGQTIEDEEESTLWPKTMRFASLSKIQRLRIALSNSFTDEWRPCSYLDKEFSAKSVGISGKLRCSMIALMPALVSLTLPCAPPKLLRRAYACDSKLSRLVVGACCDDFDNSITSLMRKAGKGASTVADVLEMFYNIRHWRKFSSEKVLIEDIKLIINSTRYSSQVFAIGDLAELMQMVYELCPRLKRFDIVLNCLSCSFAETTRKEMFRGRTNVNHFTLHLPGIERHVEFEAVVNVCLQMLPETVESIGLSISTTNVGCVKRFVNKIRSLEDISRFSYLDVVHFQIEGLPCFEVLLIEVSRSLETMREISILSAPLCRHRKELISNLKIFVTKMRNMKLLRINEQCLRLLLNANLDRRYALHKLCKEIGYKGVIESGRMPGLGEWEDGDGQFVQENVTPDKDHLLYLLHLLKHLHALQTDVPWKIPNGKDYSITEEMIEDFCVDEPDFDESFLDEEEDLSESSNDFVVKNEEVEYEDELDELDKAELQLDNDEPVESDVDEESGRTEGTEEDEELAEGSEAEEIEETQEDEDFEEEEENRCLHNGFLDDEAEEDEDEEETDSGANADDDSRSSNETGETIDNEDGVTDGETDESELESTSDSGPDLVDFVRSPQSKRVNRKRIIISESDED